MQHDRDINSARAVQHPPETAGAECAALSSAQANSRINSKTSSRTNSMSVDVEEWFQVGAFENTISRDDWEQCESRVVYNCSRVLDLFARNNVRATFFTLGWVARRQPQLIRRIVDEGHEIASHGLDHARIFTMDARGFARDLQDARAALEDAAGAAVTGYRAPSFSLDHRTPWAHEILAEQGYAYSSSIAPVKHDHYGWPEAPRFAFRPLADSDLVEWPVTTMQAMGRNFAAGGGGFFRLLPYGVFRSVIRKVHRDDNQPVIFYFHPWEVDPDQPRMNNAPLRSRLRHYSRLSAMESKLERLLRDFDWAPVGEVIDGLQKSAAVAHSPLPGATDIIKGAQASEAAQRVHA